MENRDSSKGNNSASNSANMSANNNKRGSNTQSPISQLSPNKRNVIGIVKVTSPFKTPSPPNKSSRKKTPSLQKNTLLKYFATSPSKDDKNDLEKCKKNLDAVFFSQSEADNVVQPPVCVDGSSINVPQPSVSGLSKNNMRNGEIPIKIENSDKPIRLKEMQSQVKKRTESQEKVELEYQFASEDYIDNCELPDTAEKFEEMLSQSVTWKKNQNQNCGDRIDSDEVDECELPDTPEKFEEMLSQSIKWKENQNQNCGDGIESDDDIDECELPDTPEKFKEMLSQSIKWKENQNCGDPIESDEDVDKCELPDTPEKLAEMQRQTIKWRAEAKMNNIHGHMLISFNELPDDILELVFCRIPIRNLLTEMKLVCKRWNQIISHHNFMPWKKKYFQLKSGDENLNKEIKDICIREMMVDNLVCLIGIIRYMKHFFSILESEKILPVIKKHSKYKLAICLLSETVPDCIEDEVPYLGSLITALCITSSHVNDFLEILTCLHHHNSECSVIKALECLYCLATFFYYFRWNFSINPGLHYKIYYALFCFEADDQIVNDETEMKANNAVISVQTNEGNNTPESKALKFTHEQMNVINHPLSPNQIIKIVALAGTGKTTTLAQFAKKWTNIKILNMCYNTTVCENALKIFPRNVRCQTMHSMAYRVVGYKYKLKIISKPKYRFFITFLNGEDRKRRAANALKTINNFVATADETITTVHAPEGERREDEFHTFTIEEKIIIRDDAETIWEVMIDVNKHEVKMSHDVYLKLYQLQKPVISGFDCILIDEVQDCNSAMVDIFMRQNCSKLMVGDPHQQIYSFRGAVNTLSSIQATHTYHLTQSFRFGSEIAYIASCALETMKNERKQTIVGTLNEGKVTGETKGQMAVIARTNASLFLQAVRFCQENSDLKATFLGTLKKYNYHKIIDIYHLYLRSKGEDVEIENCIINQCKNLEELKKHAEYEDDNELIGQIHIVEIYRTQIPTILKKINERCNHQLEKAEVVFSTAHKAKGHEFDTVFLTDDYITHRVENENGILSYNTHIVDDESNILYVALTRAKHRLVMSNQLFQMLLASQEKFEHFIHSNDVKDENKGSCIKCGSLLVIKNRNLLLQQQKIELSNKFVINGGPLCHICATNSDLQINRYSNIWMKYPVACDYVHFSLRIFL